jgi:hypothetical protein
MNYDLSDNQENILQHFYLKLKEKYLTENSSLESASLLLSIIKLHQNNVSKLIQDSSLSGFSFEQNDLSKLHEKKLILKNESFGSTQDYRITSFGIWFIDSKINNLNLYSILEYFEKTKFSQIISQKPLRDIEKIVLLSLIGIRNFSLSSPMDLNENSITDKWISIFNLCSDFLLVNGEIKKSEWKSNKEGNEHPITYVMRRANNLPQKTKHVYQNTGNKNYFLDIENGNASPEYYLSFLIKLIFKPFSDTSMITKTHDFLSNIAFDEAKKVTDNLMYISPEWDTVVKSSLDNFFLEN